MHEVPLLQQPLLALDEQQALTGEHEEVLLRVLAVVHRARLAGPQDAEADAELVETPVGRVEGHVVAAAVVVNHVMLARVDDEPAFADRPDARLGALEPRLLSDCGSPPRCCSRPGRARTRRSSPRGTRPARRPGRCRGSRPRPRRGGTPARRVVVGAERQVQVLGRRPADEREPGVLAAEVHAAVALVVEPVAAPRRDQLVEARRRGHVGDADPEVVERPSGAAAPWCTASMLLPSGSRRNAP